MESKIQIDVDYEMNPTITIKLKITNDVRDRLVALFIQKAVPKNMTLDGFARINRLNTLDDGTLLAEVAPIHPIDMSKYIEQINQNAAKFKTAQQELSLGIIKVDKNVIHKKCPDCAADLEVEVGTGDLKFIKHNT